MDIKVYENAPSSTQQFGRAVQAWVILSSFVTFSQSKEMKTKFKKSDLDKGLMTYGQLNLLMKREAFPWNIRVGAELGMISALCRKNGLPLLNTMVVNKETWEPSVEYDNLLFSGNRKSFRSEQKAVLKFDWLSIRTPTIRQIRLAHEAESE